MARRIIITICSMALLALALTSPQPGTAATRAGSPDVTTASHHDLSVPLRELAKLSPRRPTSGGIVPRKPLPMSRLDAMLESNPAPPVIPDPTGAGDVAMPTASGFDGISNADNSVALYPPDPDGDVGPNHYVQMVNVSLQVFSKSGTSLLGPVSANTVWSGFDGPCATTNDGDPIVQYDQYADRWLLSQFSVNGTGFHECVAVSTTPDPTGSYHRYAFTYDQFPDYPKFGVWPDGYYVSYNMFDGTTFDFLGTKVCALERAAMLAGAAASQQCFDLPQEYSLLPADADGSAPPPPGAPNYLLGEHWNDNEKLTMYRFAVDWDQPAGTTLEGPVTLDVNPYVWACITVSGKCVPQSTAATTQLLDSLGARAMYRLAYRNFGTHESLVTNHTVAMDGSFGYTAQTGIGWYEIRDPDNTVPTVHQQGTSADSDGTTFRWMGSIAQDKQGNMALGYSTSSSTTFPGIRYTGRLVNDPVNTMNQAESVIMSGTGAQTGSAGRWGDYSSMHVDPLDDCTFWYTNEYVQTTSSVGWRTRVASFKYPGCTGTATAPAAPSLVTATPGDKSATVSFTAAADGGNPVNQYTVTAIPSGASCTTRVGVTPDPLSCEVTGLTNGQAYAFTVKATNAVGEGSGASAMATPRTVPDAPTAVTASVSPSAAKVSWAAPADGGSPIASYTVVASPGGQTCTTASTSCTVNGLTNGTTYTFTVFATNAAGASAASSPSAPVTPRWTPGEPTGVTGNAASRQITTSWQPPASSGGAAITGYTAVAAPGGATCTSADTTCTITGLTNGVDYSVTVFATNMYGDGPRSAPSAVITPQRSTQSASVSLPKKVKYSGKTVLLKKAVKTNAGQKARLRVVVQPRGSKYSTVKTTSKGKVTLKTFGEGKLTVTLRLRAPATVDYTRYSRVKTWKVKK